MFKRSILNKNKIIIVDGIIGGGKSLVCPIISSLPKVDQWNMNYWFDQIVSLFHSKKISLDTASYLIKTNHNVQFYDRAMFRNVNFRKSDNTSITKHPRFKSFSKRHLYDDKKVFSNFKNNIISHYCTHMISNFSEPFFKAFKEKLIFIKIYRSPTNLEMFQHIVKWTDKWSKVRSRDGWIKFYNLKKKKNYPHFMRPNLKMYLNSNKYEKAIMILENIYYNDIFFKNNFSKYKSNIIRISFEKFTLDPFKLLKNLSILLKVNIDTLVFKQVKKFDLPREFNFENEHKIFYKFLKNKVNNNFLLRIKKLDDYYKNKILVNF